MIRALVGYGIASFAVLQVSEPIIHALHLPEWTLSFMVVALGAGFPIVVVLAWAFDVSSSGVERTAPAATAGGLKGVRLALVLIGLGLVAAAPGILYFFAIRGGGHSATGGTKSRDAVPRSPSIAVLPFADMSSGKDQEYFADGIAEEILNALAQVEGLHVSGRTSSFSFKGKPTDLTDIFSVQEEIARSVLAALKVKLLPGETPTAKERRTVNPDAYSRYLLGRHAYNQANPDGWRRASKRRQFPQAERRIARVCAWSVRRSGCALLLVQPAS